MKEHYWYYLRLLDGSKLEFFATHFYVRHDGDDLFIAFMDGFDSNGCYINIDSIENFYLQSEEGYTRFFDLDEIKRFEM